MDADSPASLSSSGTGKSTSGQIANQDARTPHPVRSPSPFVPSTSKSRRFPLPLQSVTGITNDKMGQAQSTGPSKFRRAFGPRWKKSDEPEKEERDSAWDKYRTRSGADEGLSSAQTLPQPPASTSLPPSTSNPPPSAIAKHLGKLAPRRLSISSSPVPPPSIQSAPPLSLPPASLSPPLHAKSDHSAEDRASVIINSPGISAAVQFMRQQDSPQTPTRSDNPPISHVGPERRAPSSDSLTKDDWRKSDSTMASHITIRPGAGLPRATRPVSLAESAHSVNTIVPSSRRVSVIVPDSDLVEEGDSDSEEMEPVPIARPPQSSSTPSLGLTNTSRRQSTSIFGSTTSLHSRTESESELQPPHHPYSGSKRQLLGPPRTLTPVWTEANEHGLLSGNNEQSRAAGFGIRGRFSAWTSNNSRPSPPPSPSFEPNRSASPKLPGGFRQTTLSISGNLAPAAIDLGKRAIEKIGRSWGSKYNHPSRPPSRTDHASNLIPPPSYKGKFSEYINRSHPNNSGSSQSVSLSNSSKHKRRTPDGPSGTWSISSSQSSVSIDDKMSMQSGATSLNFGRIMRGPLSIGGGAVFGRRLADCVRDTAADDVKQKLLAGDYYGEGWENDEVPPLEERLLPALVLRCAQHLLIWGIQEEGLFRLSGRASHVNRLRAEFDQGVDYNLAECDPCDIDPHVISSLFKAYLRELPEPILTNSLQPYFEAVMIAEESSETTQTASNSARGVGGGGLPLPSSPKIGNQIRKPPSLSTLAMPTFNGVRPPSRSSIHALATLVMRLPKENRDLLYTLAELIKATAKESHQTKMPLANLMLVFCPSLNMKPNLLRVLCECEDIWRAPPRAVEMPVQSDSGAEEKLETSQPPSMESSPITDVDSESGSSTGARPRNMRARRGAVQTIYAQASDSSLSINSPPDMASPDSPSLHDDTSASDISLPDVLNSRNIFARKPSPPLSSSAESLVTPSSSSKSPSFVFSTTKETPVAPLIIADQSQPPFEHLSQTITASPIPFPTSVSAPATPSSARKSLTFPNISLPIPISPPSPIRKSSRPSLNMLFSKKSGSSLRSMSISSPIPQVRSSPKPALDLQPPVLEVPLNEQPFKLHFPARKSEDDGNRMGGYKGSGLTLAPPPPINRLDSSASTESPASAMYGTPEGTPSGSVISLNRDSTYDPSSSHRMSGFRCPSRLSIAFLEEEKEEDDWSTSVFSAVGDTTGQPSQVSVEGA